MKKYSRLFLAYLAIIGCFLAGAWFIWRGMDALSYILAKRELNTPALYQSAVGRQSSFIVMAWAVITGLILLIVMVYAESYFRKGVAKGRLAQRIATIFAPELLLIFVADLVGLSSRGWQGTWVYWAVLAVELATGVLLLLYGRNAGPFKYTLKADFSQRAP